ncbi:unnamed protein product [Linum trigynum]|uniref:Uncharacterized protein n=1 Tax=Linum trigynum TaxID=586398 RepID=A0AAV2GRX5_9ROSI
MNSGDLACILVNFGVFESPTSSQDPRPLSGGFPPAQAPAAILSYGDPERFGRRNRKKKKPDVAADGDKCGYPVATEQEQLYPVPST